MGEERHALAGVDRAERLARLVAAETPLFTPSLLNCDFTRVGEELDATRPPGFRRFTSM